MPKPLRRGGAQPITGVAVGCAARPTDHHHPTWAARRDVDPLSANGEAGAQRSLLSLSPAAVVDYMAVIAERPSVD